MPQTDPSALRQELARVLGAPSFDASDRNRRFLTYIVEETLANRADRIKAYCIATEVFGRNTDFDPQIDPIVRIEAGRLRRSLERHYLLTGQAGPRLAIPRGGYVPRIETWAAGTPTEGGDRPQTPRLLIETLATPGDDPVAVEFARALTRDLTIDLSRFPSLSVHSDMSGALTPAQVDYRLSGSAEPASDRITINLLLTRMPDGLTVWANRIEREILPTSQTRIRHDIATQVARTLGQAYGVIFADRSPEPVEPETGNLGTQQAVLNFLHYWRQLNMPRIADHLQALERAVLTDPASSEANACLALILNDLPRYHRVEGEAAAAIRRRAMHHARHAVDLAPQGAWGYYALGVVYWFLQDLDGAFSALEQAVEFNPNEPLFLAELGHRHAFRMNWDLAVPMLRTAFALTGSLPPAHYVGLFLYHYHMRDYETARLMALRFSDVPVVFGPLCLGLAAIGLNLADEARRAFDKVESLVPGYLDRAPQDLAVRNLHPDLIHEVMDGIALLKAARSGVRGAGKVVSGKF